MPSYRLSFHRGQIASAVDVARREDLPAALCALGLRPPQPVLVLVGGANGLGAEEGRRLHALFRDTLAPLLERLGMAVIDGGTDAGVMARMGEARAEAGGGFPLIGVAARGTVRLPGDPPPSDRKGTRLESGHTHFLLVPGDRWGDESPWLSAAASALAAGAPSATLVAGGGKVTLVDVAEGLRADRAALLLAGSGGSADALAGALRTGELPALGVARDQAGLLRVIDLETAWRDLPANLHALLD